MSLIIILLITRGEADQLLADIDDMLADLNTHLDFMIPGADEGTQVWSRPHPHFLSVLRLSVDFVLCVESFRCHSDNYGIIMCMCVSYYAVYAQN